MWQVDNRTPFATERGWVRDRDGSEVWLVAVKATFDVLPDGTTAVAKEQPPVLRLPEHFGEPGQSSVRYDADLILTKKTTDIVVVGQAYAPEGREVTQLDCGFKVGTLQKVLRVFGDRTWGAFGPSRPEPFVTMPLVGARAYGGVARRSATDAMPSEVSFFSVAGPTPKSDRTGSPSRNAISRPGAITTTPRPAIGPRRPADGLAASEASLAIDLLAATPTEHDRPSSEATRARISRAMARGVP